MHMSSGFALGKRPGNKCDQGERRCDDKVETGAIRFGTHLYYAEDKKDKNQSRAYEESHFSFPSGRDPVSGNLAIASGGEP